MDEKKIGLFITNLRDYTNGNLNGEWVYLPCSKEDMKEVFARRDINGNDSEYFITDYDINIHGLYNNLGEFENLDELNYLATLINEMESYDYDKFINILEAGIDDCRSVSDYINLTFNIDNYDILPAHNDAELGMHIAEDLGVLDELPQINGVDLAYYIDYEAIGRDYSINAMGNFGRDGFVERIWDDEECFQEVPDEYKIKPDMSIENEKLVANSADVRENSLVR
ncbi:MAG: antirestriction protein ArdA [Lachnospiraceae bacterium]|nr:antirestriction protein ArdA [Lachnospiraceae bacterium]MBQ8319022.1 antirestriction protein ArdA [Lachnospiraceae bacterium]